MCEATVSVRGESCKEFASERRWRPLLPRGRFRSLLRRRCLFCGNTRRTVKARRPTDVATQPHTITPSTCQEDRQNHVANDCSCVLVFQPAACQVPQPAPPAEPILVESQTKDICVKTDATHRRSCSSPESEISRLLKSSLRPTSHHQQSTRHTQTRATFHDPDFGVWSTQYMADKWCARKRKKCFGANSRW